MFIVFEGIDGVGKTTQSKLLYDYMCKNNYATILTSEPRGTRLGIDIEALMDIHDGLSVETQVLLFNAARSHHYDYIIKPMQEEGFYVICDRFVGSTIVYQGMLNGYDIRKINNINDFATGGEVDYSFGKSPDTTFLIDTDDYAAYGDEYDEKTFSIITKSYRELALYRRWNVIDAAGSIDDIHSSIVKIVKSEIFARGNNG